MKNKSTPDFKNIDQVLNGYCKMEIKEKLETIKKYSNVIIYNADYQKHLSENYFLEIILNDLIQIENDNFDIINMITYKSYVRHFFLLFHNLIVGNSESQILNFNCLFFDWNIIHNSYQKSNSNFTDLKRITSAVINENKIRKFALSIIYNLIFMNDRNSNKLNEAHLDYISEIITSHDYNLTLEAFNKDSDLNEINDWLHILLDNFMKREIYYEEIHGNSTNNSRKPLVSYFLDLKNPKNRILFLELFRDFVDYAKDSKSLYVNEQNLNLFIFEFIKNVEVLDKFIEKEGENLFKCFVDLEMSQDINICYSFREFICYVDIISVILVQENSEFRIKIHENLSNQKIIDSFYNILRTTDSFYETIFKRNKLLNQDEKINIPTLNEKSIFHGFQTNIMKFLSNFAYKNENLKEIFLSDDENRINHISGIKMFYYFLNHMKLDKCNPFKKEWTVLLIKSLTENNYKIQNLIEILNPQEMDPLIKDYIINKGNIKLGDKDVCMDLLKKKEE